MRSCEHYLSPLRSEKSGFAKALADATVETYRRYRNIHPHKTPPQDAASEGQNPKCSPSSGMECLTVAEWRAP